MGHPRNIFYDGGTRPGCIKDVKTVYRDYIGASLTNDECSAIDNHLLNCRYCESAWDARSLEFEETLASEIEEIVDDTDDLEDDY